MNSETRPLLWSVKRELWENRSLVLAPLIVASVVLFGFIVSTLHLPQRRREVLLLDEIHRRQAIQKPYDIAAVMLIMTGAVVAAFYCLDALHGERRDRSILFWKSLPVSDATTVLSKASIPLVVLPLYVFVVIIATQILMLLLSSIVLLGNGLSPVTTWVNLRFIPSIFILLYGLVVFYLWHAPFYGWLLVVSAWAKRATAVWALMPIFAVGILFAITGNGKQYGLFLKHRFMGGTMKAFAFPKSGLLDSIHQLTPGEFLASGELWFGLILCAGFLALAVRLRRSREPV